MSLHPLLRQRRAGVLLHPTSLPGEGECGTLGQNAYRFVDFLAAAGMSVWQMLPVGPTHGDLSPYQALSVHAGNPRLIDLPSLVSQGWLPEGCEATNEELLAQAWEGFQTSASVDEQAEFQRFVVSNEYWLRDYVLFVALRGELEGQPWWEWPEALRDREATALAEAHVRLEPLLQRYRFEQYCFDRQWRHLKSYANERGIFMFGDLPIFVALDSVDVWVERDLFLLDEAGRPTVVAGVPPDYFSATGQRWGNPLYDWQRMAEDDYAWWVDRMRSQFRLFDLVRIDHFRGFEAFWEIPAECPTAVDGHWVPGPGAVLFTYLEEALGPLPLVAEDLGLITEEVTQLRRNLFMPGMKILQFAFDGGADNPYLPHGYSRDYVVYTGTHDNDTTLGWYAGLSDEQRDRVSAYLGWPGEAMPWPLIRSAISSVAAMAVLPLQDLLELDGSHRMNVPGTSEGNWSWRFEWSMFNDALAPRLNGLLQDYQRNAD